MFFFTRIPRFLLLSMLLITTQSNLNASTNWSFDRIIVMAAISSVFVGAAYSLFCVVFFDLSNKEVVGRCMRIANEVKQSLSPWEQYYTAHSSLSDDALKQQIRNDGDGYPFIFYESKLVDVIETVRKNVIKLQNEVRTVIDRKIKLNIHEDKNYQDLFGAYTKALSFVDALESRMHTLIDLLINHRNRIILFPEYLVDIGRYKVAKLDDDWR